jgi:hypothetical protein
MTKTASPAKVSFLPVAVFFLFFLFFDGVALFAVSNSSNGPAALSGASMSAAAAGGSGSGADNLSFSGEETYSIPIGPSENRGTTPASTRQTTGSQTRS